MRWRVAGPELGAPRLGDGAIWVPADNPKFLADPPAPPELDPIEIVEFYAVAPTVSPASPAIRARPPGWQAIYVDSPATLDAEAGPGRRARPGRRRVLGDRLRTGHPRLHRTDDALRNGRATVTSGARSIRSGFVTGVSTDSGSQLIVIGSSAGGIEALSRLVANLPAGPPGRGRARPAPRSEALQPPGRDPRAAHDAAAQGGRRDDRARRRRDLRRAPNRLVEVGEDGLRLRRPKSAARSRRRSTSCSRAPPRSMASGYGRDPDRDRVRRLVRGVARQAGRRHRRHREPRDGHVPVDAGGRSRRRWSMRGPISTAIAEVVVGLSQSGDGVAEGDEDDAFASTPRSGPGTQRDRLQHVQGGHHRAPAARPDARDGQPVRGRLRGPRRARPGRVRAPGREPADQGHGVLPRPEGLGSPARSTSCRPSSRMPGARAASCASGPPAAPPARRPTRWR